MDRLLQLVGAPWDALLVQPGGGKPEFSRDLLLCARPSASPDTGRLAASPEC